MSVTQRPVAASIFFSAYRRGAHRQLSNLFGKVEWAYQMHKFRTGSSVHTWLAQGLAQTFSLNEFDRVRQSMRHPGTLASYVHGSDFAEGLLAQLTSIIAQRPTALLARQRLSYIMGDTRTMSGEEAMAWHRKNVVPELTNAEKDAILQAAIFKKFCQPKFFDLLVATGDKQLHEAKGRGRPNRYQYHVVTRVDAQGTTHVASSGGDIMGRMLMRVRDELLFNLPVSATPL